MPTPIWMLYHKTLSRLSKIFTCGLAWNTWMTNRVSKPRVSRTVDQPEWGGARNTGIFLKCVRGYSSKDVLPRKLSEFLESCSWSRKLWGLKLTGRQLWMRQYCCLRAPFFFFLCITLKPRVEWYKSLWTLNTSLPRNRFKLLRSSCSEIENCHLFRKATTCSPCSRRSTCHWNTSDLGFLLQSLDFGVYFWVLTI